MKIKLSLQQKTVCAILVLAFVLTVTAGVISYRVYAGTMDSHYQTLTLNVAKTAAAVVDPEQVRAYTDAVTDIYLQNPAPGFKNEAAEQAYLKQYDGVRDAGYIRLFDTLELVKLANDVRSLYVVYVDPQSMTCVYVVDADDSENACLPGTWDIIYPQNYEVASAPEKGFPAYITNTEEFGWLCSAGAPIKGADGKVIAHAMVDISMDGVMRDRQMYLVRLCLILLVVTGIMIVAFIRVVNRAVIDPINHLAHAAASYVSDQEHGDVGEELSAIARLNIRTGDEVENLCTAIQKMERDINGYINNLTAVTAEKERIGAELDVAKHIQASMLPCIFPAFPNRCEFDIYATMTPAKEVGGDFYDFFLVDENHLAVIMADVSGKGVPAALFMVITKTIIKNLIQTGLTPAKVLEEANRQLCENNEAEMFVTVWLGILEIPSGKLTCANAGHEYPVLKRENGSYELIKDKHGFVLAGMENASYSEYELWLKPGDQLYLYTDGVPEATYGGEELFGIARMMEVLNQNKNVCCKDLLCQVKEAIDTFVGESPQFDDITMLSLKLAGGRSGE